jgi:poly-gamma-glutamate capsule biosynthesis protein CapA/YwtB (metallophosphatase superfamily)
MYVGSGALLLLSACSAASTQASSAPATSSSSSSAAAQVGAQSASATPLATSRPKSSPATSVTIAAVGDTMLGNTPDLPPDPAGYYDAVKKELRHNAQIVFGNLEGTLTTAPGNKCGSSEGITCFAFRDPPEYAHYYRDAGFTVLNDANNHSYDFGSAGQAQTVQSIHSAGMAQTGLPGEITTVTAKGVKVAFVAFAPYNWTANLLNLPAAQTLIKRAAQEASVVVVYMHVGAEGSDADHVTGHEEIYLGEDRGNPEGFAHMAINAGASLVLASGPHVLRGMQFYKGHLIAYSLGDFANYGDFSLDGDLDTSAILHVTLSSAGSFDSARIYPVLLTGKGEPTPGGGAVSFIKGLSLDDFGSSAARISSSGAITRP